MKMQLLAASAAICLFSAASAAKAAIVVNFDDLSAGAVIDEAYNGGVDSLSESGPNLGIEFVNFTVADQSGNGPYGNPSQPNLAYNNNSLGFINVAAGFTSLSFSYGFFSEGQVSVFSDLNGNGALLGTVDLLTSDPHLPWQIASVAFAGLGKSVVVGTNTANYGFDNVTFNGGAVPEPAAWALMLLGFGGMGAALRRRRMLVTA
ncbi:MAG: PEPxxWA-CTERM sorting domain-containing protein [Phenylobacterium sp.]